MIPRSFRTPLSGTVLVILGLAGLAVPLMKLTDTPESGILRPHPPAESNDAIGSEVKLPTVLRIRLLIPVHSLILRDADGRELVKFHDVPAGESEHDVLVSVFHGETSLSLEADFPQLSGETAIFLTLMPDGHEDRTAYAVGNHMIRETLQFSWEAANSRRPGYAE